MANLILRTKQSNISLELGTEHHREGGHIQVYATNNDYRTGKSIYEADKGYVILEAIPRIISQWGDSSWSTSLTGRDSNVETIEKIDLQFQEIMKAARSNNDEKNEQMAIWIQKQILDYYFKYSSTNARFEVFVACKSHEIRIPLPWPLNPKIDTKTANLNMSFTIRTLKLITPEELMMIRDFMNFAIGKGLVVDYEYN